MMGLFSFNFLNERSSIPMNEKAKQASPVERYVWLNYGVVNHRLRWLWLVISVQFTHICSRRAYVHWRLKKVWFPDISTGGQGDGRTNPHNLSMFKQLNQIRDAISIQDYENLTFEPTADIWFQLKTPCLWLQTFKAAPTHHCSPTCVPGICSSILVLLRADW